MMLSIDLPRKPEKEFYSVASADFYQQLKNLSDTIISLQYSANNFLTFKVQEASRGSVVSQGAEVATLQCQVRGTTYTFTREHLDQMSNRELNELLNQLGLEHF